MESEETSLEQVQALVFKDGELMILVLQEQGQTALSLPVEILPLDHRLRVSGESESPQ